VLPFTESNTENFSGLRTALGDRRRETMNQLIATHAVSIGVTLATNNEADFTAYPSHLDTQTT
jgi:tRNA(fMet)-specific endonuclease VapC